MTADLSELITLLRKDDSDRDAAVDGLTAWLNRGAAASNGDRQLHHLVRKVVNLSGSPHFDEAVADVVAALDALPPPSADGVGDLDEATRDELYELARRADVPGRSRMTKEELRRALDRRG